MPHWIKLKNNEFQTIIDKYDIGKYKSHKHLEFALENTVYILKTTKGKFILKIYPLKVTNKFLRFQMRLIDYLHKRKVSVPYFIKNNDNLFISKYNNHCVTLQSFIRGKHPAKLSDNLIKDFAKKLSRLHEVLLNADIRGSENWGEHQFEIPFSNYLYIFVNVFGFPARKEYKKYLAKVRNLNRKKLRKCIIHRDISKDNILVKGNKLITFLDFADSGRDYFAYDIAVIISHMFFINGKGLNLKNIKNFLKHYNPPIKLINEEIKAIYYFIKQRQIGVICWNKMHNQYNSKNECEKWINQYWAYDKISFEEFKSIFNK